MELNKTFNDGLWSKEINVRDFVSNNITPYYGDASFLQGPTERTKAVWNCCLKALEEERANNGVLTTRPFQPSPLIKPDTLIKKTSLSSDYRQMNC